MTDVPPWPWPGDSELEKRERIARDYRNALHALDPAYCAQLDNAYRRLGQRWITPELATIDLTAVVPAWHLAEIIGVKPHVIYQWAHRGHITPLGPKGRPVYLVREAIDYHAELRERRIKRHAKNRSGRDDL